MKHINLHLKDKLRNLLIGENINAHWLLSEYV